ncbi:hypothetical protein EVA_20584 [gut metagenome]|uniref:Uncharacterized protein n=1 Tax=gut metagenome TaxID=749906 RepID=J9FA47_9ZZZZ
MNADKTGFENFNLFGHEEDLSAGGEKMFTLDGLWNGTGDFKLSFTGVIYISLLVFSTNKADALAYKYRTLFEQSDRLVKISAAVFDKDGEALKETGLVIKPEGAGLYAQDASGKVALIGVSVEDTDEQGNPVSKIKLTADHLQLEGVVTANGNFKILEDGSMVCRNAAVYGKIFVEDGGKVGAFTVERNCMLWKNGSAEIRLGYDGYWVGDTCIYAKAEVCSNAIVGIAPFGGAGIFGSCRSNPTYPGSNILCAGCFDGDLLVQNGNILVSGGIIQGDEVWPQNGWSGRFKGKTVEVKNGIIVNVS